MPVTGARNLISVAPPPVLRDGILGAADVIDVTDPHDLLGAEYETDACIDGIGTPWPHWCQPVDSPDEKSFDTNPGIVAGDPHITYAGVQCGAQSQERMLERAARKLSYIEGPQLDAIVQAELIANDTPIAGGPYLVDQAIGLLEAQYAHIYGGVPTIVIPRNLTTIACSQDVIHREDGRLVTCGGSRVASISPGEFTGEHINLIFIVGRITVLRGPVNRYVSGPSYTATGAIDDQLAMAERVFVPLIECTPLSAATL